MIDPTTTSLSRLAPLAIPLVIAAIAIWARWPDNNEPQPVEVTSTAPTFDTLAELASASDLIVIATIDGVSPGRAITESNDPNAGIRTTLYELRIETVVAGTTADRITVEHETALLDGTPITIDGVEAPRRDEHGLYFLIAGTSDEFPHLAFIGPQGRYPINGSTLTALTTDPVGRMLGRLEVTDAMEQIHASP